MSKLSESMFFQSLTKKKIMLLIIIFTWI